MSKNRQPSVRRSPRRRPASGYHRVKEGEWISKIAANYGIADWWHVWHDPKNEALRNKRQEPNVIFVGDRLFIPEIADKYEKGETDKRHRFRLKIPQKKIIIDLIDEDGEPRAGIPCVLQIDNREYHEIKRTDDAGRIAVKVPEGAESGYLYVGEDRSEIYEIRLGGLDPIDEFKGRQERLANLGLYAGKIDGDEGQVTRNATIAYQDWENELAGKEVLVVDGIFGTKTQAKMKERHGY